MKVLRIQKGSFMKCIRHLQFNDSGHNLNIKNAILIKRKLSMQKCIVYSEFFLFLGTAAVEMWNSQGGN